MPLTSHHAPSTPTTLWSDERLLDIVRSRHGGEKGTPRSHPPRSQHQNRWCRPCFRRRENTDFARPNRASPRQEDVPLHALKQRASKRRPFLASPALNGPLVAMSVEGVARTATARSRYAKCRMIVLTAVNFRALAVCRHHNECRKPLGGRPPEPSLRPFSGRHAPPNPRPRRVIASTVVAAGCRAAPWSRSRVPLHPHSPSS